MSAAISSGPTAVSAEARELEQQLGHLWWLGLVTGISWILASLVILQFDRASITTIGIIVGCMFLFAGTQQLVLGFIGGSLRWLRMIFGALFVVCGVICFVRPENTFAGMADILGFLFATVGIWWTLSAFLQRDTNDAWWVGLLSGIAMIVVAFWTSGQFFIEKAYTLLVFAGIWALMQGVRDIVLAFHVRRSTRF
jgi:uncharacterized membrane protein HdeD (DUF308 family)